MPHYITQLEREGEFAVYSTIVDGLLTEPMTGAQMRAWLADNNYTSWLVSDNSDLDDGDWSEDTRQTVLEWRERTARWMYWDEEHGFKFVKLSDAYFVLPRRDWRNGA